MSLASRAERDFERWARFVIRHRHAVLLASLAVAGGLVAGLPRLELDFSSDAFLARGDATRETYDAFRERWGDDEFILVGIDPPAVFDLEVLAKLRALHRELERELPHVDELSSLVNARDTRAEGDTLIAGDLLEPWPETAADLARIEARARDNPAYRNRLISRGHDYTAILIRLDAFSSRHAPDLDAVLEGFDDSTGATAAAPLSQEEQWETLEVLYDVAGRYDAPDFRIAVSGGPVLMHHMTELNAQDVRRYTSSAFLLIFVLLFAIFRRVTATLVPLAIVFLSITSTFGAMGWLGLPVTLVTQSVPSFLMAVAVCDSIHVLAIAYRERAAGKGPHEALVSALGHSGLAVVLTSITTAGGLLSFRAAELVPIQHLGVASPLGVLLALGFSLTTLPALLAIVPLRPPPPSVGASGAAGPVDRLLRRLGDFAIARPVTVVIGTAALLVVGAAGLSQLRTSNSALEWFHDSDPVRQALLRIDEQFEGIQAVEVWIDSGRENGLHDPALLGAMQASTEHALALREGPVRVASAISVVDVVKESHRALHADDPTYYAVPDDRATIAQELLLFENGGADDLERLVDTSFREARLTFTSSWADAAEYVPFLETLEAELRRILGPDVSFAVTGDMSVFARAWRLLVPSMLRSYAVALLIITPLMVLLVGTWRRGLLAMVPNLVPIYLTLALMGALDIPLSITTMIIGSMILGIAVDDTIHFMHKFNQYSEAGLGTEAAIRETLTTTGVALLGTSLALAGSYLIYLMASFRGLMQFGLLASFAVAVAFLADVVLAPALLVLASRRAAATGPTLAPGRGGAKA